MSDSKLQVPIVGCFHCDIAVLLLAQLLWLEMALFSKKALRNIEKHS